MEKAIYKPKGAAKEYGLWACNLYNGCSNKCDYCYNRHCPQSVTLGGDKVTLKKSLSLPEGRTQHDNIMHAYGIFRSEFNKHKDEIIRDGGLFFSFVSDPMLDETYELSILCAGYAVDHGCVVTMLTKCTYPVEYFKNEVHRDMYRLGFTLTGMDSMEHGKYGTGDRIDNMLRLNVAGIKTWASIEPVIDFDCALDAIARSSDYCNFYKIGLASKIGKQYTQQEVMEFVEKVSELVTVPIYWKESVRKALGNPACLPNQVKADYKF